MKTMIKSIDVALSGLVYAVACLLGLLILAAYVMASALGVMLALTIYAMKCIRGAAERIIE